MMKIFFIGLLVLVLISLASAHQPRIVFEGGTLENPIIVDNPEISKAYYGNLSGMPDYYLINSSNNFTLYVNILVPDLIASRMDFNILVTADSYFRMINKSEWESFYEEFGGDYYLRGPELEEKVAAGEYLIIISNPDNLGKYSLAVGKVESFPLNEIFNTIVVLPKIKKHFFERPAIMGYFNYVGLFILIFFVAAIILIIGLVTVIKLVKKRIFKKLDKKRRGNK